jgi:putative Holliday junction resolvase
MRPRLLGLDYGEKRIGVAMSDPLGITAQALPFIPNTDKAVEAVYHIVQQYDVKKIILGLPKNRDGGETKSSEDVRSFANLLSLKITEADIDFWDERFSTAAVTRHLIGMDMRRDKRKQVVDGQAAAFILQGYLDRLARL